jgi:tRNA pseudouridine38-40 synthase
MNSEPQLCDPTAVDPTFNQAQAISSDPSDAFDSNSAAKTPGFFPGTAARRPYHNCPEGRHRVRIDISYDGSAFFGWQRQTSQVSVQGTIEQAVSKIYGEPIKVIGASRTDTGVHAKQQVAHFDAPKMPGGFDLRYSIQCQLPEAISIEKLYLAPPHFHSIACVVDKTYRYQVLNRHVPSALQRGQTYWLRAPIDLEFANACTQKILGTHDFKAFKTSGNEVSTTIRTISNAFWSKDSDSLVGFSVTGDGFMKQMVRNLVGTILWLQKYGRPVEDMVAILNSLDRRQAGPTAPAHALFLESIRYPTDLDIQCRHLY